MKKIVLFSLAILLSGSIFAANLKIGVLDVQKIARSAPQVVKMRTAMQKTLHSQIKPEAAKMKSQQTQLNDLIAKYKKDSLTMTDVQKKKLQAQISGVQANLQQAQVSVRKLLTQSQTQDMGKLMKLIEGAVTKVAKTQKLTLVIAKNTVAYSDPSLDITDQVIKNLD